MGIQNTSAIPASVVNSGNGILWANPANATGTGAGTAIASLVNTFSITSNVVTFATNPQNFVVGQSPVNPGFAPPFGSQRVQPQVPVYSYLEHRVTFVRC